MLYSGTTVAFSTKANVWKTRYSFTPTCYMTMDNDFLSSNIQSVWSDMIAWKHDVNTVYNSFYGGAPVPSSLEVVSNDNPSSVKVFKALSIESSTPGWTGSVYTNKDREATALQMGDFSGFMPKEGNQYSAMPRSTINSTSNITFLGVVDITTVLPLYTVTETEAFNPADFNLSGGVTTGDILILLGGFGITVENLPPNMPPSVDMDGDGVVSTIDLITFLSHFGEGDIIETNVESNFNADLSWDVPLLNTPDIAVATSTESLVFFGDKLLSIDDNLQVYSALDGYNPNGLKVIRYNDDLNTISLKSGLVGEIAIQTVITQLLLQFSGQLQLPVYIMTNPAQDGDSMRGPYAGIKLTLPDSSTAFELFAINVDYEKTKLDGSLG